MQTHDHIVNALLCDSYKMVMAYSFFQNNMQDDPTAFELYFRKCPFQGEYVVFAGLSEVMGYLNTFKFTKEQLDYISQSILPKEANPKFIEYLAQLDCSKVKIRALKEGTLCFPKEPLISIEGPQVICQLVETAIINLVSFPSLVATNASRMRQMVGKEAKLVEFGLRRAQGPDGGLSATQYSYLGGFDGSSNMLAGFKYNIPISGTVAHSFITSFTCLDDAKYCELNGVNLKTKSLEYLEQMNVQTNQSELASFIAYGQSLPDNFVCLVDTYNTLKSGIPNFLAVAFALQDAGYNPKGIRLDSGDLAELSKEAKRMFKHFGEQFKKDTSKFIVVASNDINEESLKKFKEQGHGIDVFGIGTNLVTCQKQPALGLVYKLIECNGKGTMKLSEEKDKTTWPYQKNVYRLYFKSGRIVDLVSSLEYTPEIEIQAIDPTSFKRYHLKPYFVESLLQEVDLNYLLTLEQSKKHLQKQIDEFDQCTIRIDKPQKQLVLFSLEFNEKFNTKLEELQLEEIIQ